MAEENKISVLVVPSDRSGVGLYRSVSPHVQLDKLYGNEFSVDIEYEPHWGDLEYVKKYNIIHFHKGIFPKMDEFHNALKFCKENGIVTIMDIDDNWDVGPQHPMYRQLLAMKIPEKIVNNFKLVDYVTTTTEIFAKKIRKYNPNVFVFPNAVDPEEEQYQPIKNPSEKIRFGFVMGSSHEKDMEQIRGVVNQLPQDVKDKIQIVLCGYDLGGTVTIMNPDGTIKDRRPIQPHESVWYRYEQIVTDNYKICSPEYKSYLLRFNREEKWPDENESYKRQWTMGVHEFAKHYRNIDVLLAPLAINQFNEVKSELKFIEAGFTNTAIICTNFGPYTIGSKGLFKFGGGINEDATAVLIDDRKKHKDWAKAITKLTREPDLINLLKNNLYEHVKDTYDIRNVTKKRAQWYKDILKK